jgi:hypothetical protein
MLRCIKIKRYNFVEDIRDGLICAEENKKGIFVLYEDMVKEIKRQVRLAEENIINEVYEEGIEW